MAQQVLAVCLQQLHVGRATWPQEWNELPPFDRSADPIVSHLLAEGFIERDGELLFIGPEAEHRFGRLHFMDMTAVFAAPPELTVFHGRTEIGRTDPMLLTERIDGPRLLLLAGRSWKVTWIDWKRRHCFVESVESGGRARWVTGGTSGASFALAGATRDVLLGADPPASLTSRASRVLTETRRDEAATVTEDGTVVVRAGDDVRWWTWAGHRANATLAASLADLTHDTERFGDTFIRLRGDLTPALWREGRQCLSERMSLPAVDERAMRGLKFNEVLPGRLAEATLAARLADLDGAGRVLGEHVTFTVV